MSQLDMYRNTLLKKQEDISKLNQDMAKEQAKIAPLQKKIISAKGAISRTKSQSTIKSKLNEIERAEKSISDIQKKCGDIQKKIAQKEKERSTAEKNYRNEEAKVNRKNMEAEKKRQQDVSRQAAAFERSLKEYGNVQSHMQLEIERLKAIPEKITVLFLAANPKDTPKLSLDEEARSIQEKIRLSEYRDSVRFESRWATRASDILQAINETNPTIVHFSGHGAPSGELALLNPDGSTKTVTKEAITMAMSKHLVECGDCLGISLLCQELYDSYVTCASPPDLRFQLLHAVRLVDKEAGTKALTPEGKLYNEPKISLYSEADEIFKNLSFPVKDGRIDTGHLIRRAEKEMTYLNLSTSTRWQYM